MAQESFVRDRLSERSRNSAQVLHMRTIVRSISSVVFVVGDYFVDGHSSSIVFICSIVGMMMSAETENCFLAHPFGVFIHMHVQSECLTRLHSAEC